MPRAITWGESERTAGSRQLANQTVRATKHAPLPVATVAAVAAAAAAAAPGNVSEVGS